MVAITVPNLGESVSQATVARWIKQAGSQVAADEPVVELETDKVTVEVNAPAAGTLSVTVAEGGEVEVGAVLGEVGPGNAAASPAPAPAANPASGVTAPPPPSGPVSRPASPPPAAGPTATATDATAPTQTPPSGPAPFPSAQKLMTEHGLAPKTIGEGSGKDERITKGDVLAFLNRPPAAVPSPAPKTARQTGEREERVKMTRLRRTIATRLKEAQNTAAMLTTFNEVDMSAAMALRTEYKDAFEKRHGVRLGFMGFFVRACCAALEEFPAVNAEVDGEDIIYKRFVHMGIAVGGPAGLVVPVIRDAQDLSFAGVERAVSAFGKKAKDGALSMDDLSAGTFSITNGGVYGSLLSTPILNPPQSAILGMHAIKDRAVVVGGAVVARPMMYLALSYDHRIVDGKEAVSFLVRVRDAIEDPRRLLLEV